MAVRTRFQLCENLLGVPYNHLCRRKVKFASSSLIAAKRLEPCGRIVHAFLHGYVRRIVAYIAGSCIETLYDALVPRV